ncbi:MAG: hypothetical protein H7A37_03820 [Chlamydiales bacterium]|nr:hypothetical protein [Chlamydiia bacterium]MCP5507414.1 hypothetical protein [Chlamydiales bacterium]
MIFPAYESASYEDFLAKPFVFDIEAQVYEYPIPLRYFTELINRIAIAPPPPLFPWEEVKEIMKSIDDCYKKAANVYEMVIGRDLDARHLRQASELLRSLTTQRRTNLLHTLLTGHRNKEITITSDEFNEIEDDLSANRDRYVSVGQIADHIGLQLYLQELMPPIDVVIEP